MNDKDFAGLLRGVEEMAAHMHGSEHARPVNVVVPTEAIDVAGWNEDEEWARYPEGARAKSAYFPPDHDVPGYIKRDRRYLFKRSQKRYSEQFWAEIAAYHIGSLVGVEVPPAYPAINSSSGHCAALIEWFYVDGHARFVSGGQYMQKLIEGFDRKQGTQHNFRTIRALFRGLMRAGIVAADWPESWAKMVLFDALCGNTDRHPDNWGVVFPLGQNEQLAHLSPCYDNGTSLGHELWEIHQGLKWGQARWLKYVADGTHHMKWTIDDERRAGHMELVRRVAEQFAHLRPALLASLQGFDLEALRATLEALRGVRIDVPLTAWRADLIYKLVVLRRRQLLSILE